MQQPCALGRDCQQVEILLSSAANAHSNAAPGYVHAYTHRGCDLIRIGLDAISSVERECSPTRSLNCSRFFFAN